MDVPFKETFRRRSADASTGWSQDSDLASPLMLAVFFGLAVLERLPMIRANVLWKDDFAVPYIPWSTYVGSFRPIMFAEYMLIEAFAPNHLWHGLSKWFGALYLAMSCVLMVHILRKRLRFRPAPACAAALFVLLHPISTDAAFWSSIHAMPLGLCFALGAVAVLYSNRRLRFLTATSLVVISGLTYQSLVTIPIVFEILRFSLTHGTPLKARIRNLARSASVVAIAGAICLGYMQFSQSVMQEYDHRGSSNYVSIQSFANEKYHGLVNNVVNVYMPPIAMAWTPQEAFRWWKYVPLLLGIALFAAGSDLTVSNRLVLALLPALLPLAGASIYSITGFSPWAWRTSLPALVGVALALSTLLQINTTRPGRVSAYLLVVGLIAISTFASSVDANRRTLIDQSDRDLFRHFPLSRGRSSCRLIVIRGRTRNVGAFDDGLNALTEGYKPMNRGWYSAWSDPWTLKYFVWHETGRPTLDCLEAPLSKICNVSSRTEPGSGIAFAPETRTLYIDSP